MVLLNLAGNIMAHSDPISDFFTRLRNAVAIGHDGLSMPYSKQKEVVAKVLMKEDILSDVRHEGSGTKKTLLLKLPAGEAIYHNYKRISKPGQRIYVTANKVLPVQNGFGLSIISTSKGIMTDKEARKVKLGGELIVEIW